MRIFRSVLLGASLTASAVLAAQEDETLNRVAQIRAAPSRFINEQVQLEGQVIEFVDSSTQTTSFYRLRDDWGGTIKIRTSKDRPDVGKRYFISGPVGVDPKTRDLYVSEEVRTERVTVVGTEVRLDATKVISPPKVDASVLPPQVPADRPPVATQTDTKPPGSKLATYAMLGGGAFIVLAVAGAMMFRSRNQELGSSDFSLASAVRTDPIPAPEQIIEGRTIKLHAPPPNTVKMLPGWFEVVSGDEVVKQIRFYKLGDQNEETTFGRATGRPYAHVQLKAPTVSSRQAKVFFDGATAKLTNFASTDSNPTRVNGRSLAVNQTVSLSESDRVEMGEVSLMFHEAPISRPLVG